MLLVQQVTSDPLQTQTIILPDGSSFSLTLYFSESQIGWFITNFTYGTFVLNGVRVTNNPNILNQWRNILPFGLACFSSQNREPTQAQDFSSGASNLYVLTQAEVLEYSEYLQGE